MDDGRSVKYINSKLIALSWVKCKYGYCTDQGIQTSQFFKLFPSIQIKNQKYTIRIASLIDNNYINSLWYQPLCIVTNFEGVENCLKYGKNKNADSFYRLNSYKQ